jgi:hypothetical protein
VGHVLAGRQAVQVFQDDGHGSLTTRLTMSMPKCGSQGHGFPSKFARRRSVREIVVLTHPSRWTFHVTDGPVCASRTRHSGKYAAIKTDSCDVAHASIDGPDIEWL